MRKLIIGAAALALIAGGAWWAKREGLILRDEFAYLCDEAIKEGLRSPSTYRVTQVRELSKPASDEEIAKSCASRPDGEKRAECIDLTRILGTQSHLRLVNYEAANTYGTPVAGMSSCRVLSTKARDRLNEDSRLEWSMDLDGQTSHERSMAKIEALNSAIQADRELLQRLEGGR